MNDPFGGLGDTEETNVSVDAQSDDAYFTLDMTLEEEDFEQREEFTSSSFRRPADKSWVPVRIISAKIGERDKARLVVPDGDGGEMAEVITPEHPMRDFLLRFELEAELGGDPEQPLCYGERPNAYLLSPAVHDQHIPLRNPKGKRTSFVKRPGRYLLAATRVVRPGQKVNRESLDELAAAMVGKVVMAQIRHVHKEYPSAEPRKDDSGKLIKAKVDEHGAHVQVIRGDDGTLRMEEGGAPFPGDGSDLIHLRDNIYLIPDPSPEGALVHDNKTITRTFDNLQDEVQPVPDRNIQISRVDGSTVAAEVTWDTVGQITAIPVKPGTYVQAVTDQGEIVTASWLGTQWIELAKPHRLEVGDLGELRFVPDEVMAPSTPAGSLDVFKADTQK